MVECARLEIAYTGNRIKGSNPFVSARNRTALRYFFVEFLRVLWYNCGQRTDAMRPLFLFYPAPRDFFIYPKKEMNMKQPGFFGKINNITSICTQTQR